MLQRVQAASKVGLPRVSDKPSFFFGGQAVTYQKDPRVDAVRQIETINTRALAEMFPQIIANNRAGGWRKIKQEGR